MGKIILQWDTWFYGLGAALIGGGAGAIATGFAQVLTDPNHSDIKHLLVMMGTSFAVAGLLSAAAYLKQSPLPPVITTVDVQKTITPTPEGGVIIQSTQVTTQDKPKAEV